MDVCIVGAGVIGLSTALAIQERNSSPLSSYSSSSSSTTLPPKACLKNTFLSSLTIIADRIDHETVSVGSGGQVCPFLPPGIPEHIGRQWCQDSIDYFHKLAFSTEASNAGLSIINGYQFSNEKNFPILQYATNIREMDEREMRRFGSGQLQFRYGHTATYVFVEMPIYMRWMMKRFLANGGKVFKRKLDTLEELVGQYDLVVNCTGMGSQELLDDPCLRPVRGQVVHVEAPWIKSWVRLDSSIVIFPFSKSVLIGSVKQEDNNDRTISQKDTDHILNRARKLFPPLKNARVLWEWVGMRPQRDSIRVEKEIMNIQGKELKIVHNYGHGSIGVSMSWGCAVHATNLVESMCTNQSTLASRRQSKL